MKSTLRTREPLQERSRLTLDRILGAAEKMLEESTLEEASVATIVERAGASIGSFYARFPDKEALVEALLDRYHAHVGEMFDAFAGDRRWEAADLRMRVEALVRLVVKVCRQRRGLLRTRLVLSLGPQRRQTALQLESNTDLVAGMVAFLEPSLGEVQRRPAKSALRFALQMIDATVMSSVVLEDIEEPSYGKMSDARLVRELSAAVYSYLTSG